MQIETVLLGTAKLKYNRNFDFLTVNVLKEDNETKEGIKNPENALKYTICRTYLRKCFFLNCLKRGLSSLCIIS